MTMPKPGRQKSRDTMNRLFWICPFVLAGIFLGCNRVEKKQTSAATSIGNSAARELVFNVEGMT